MKFVFVLHFEGCDLRTHVNIVKKYEQIEYSVHVYCQVVYSSVSNNNGF
jgi:hypothetical protein